LPFGWSTWSSIWAKCPTAANVHAVLMAVLMLHGGAHGKRIKVSLCLYCRCRSALLETAPARPPASWISPSRCCPRNDRQKRHRKGIRMTTSAKSKAHAATAHGRARGSAPGGAHAAADYVVKDIGLAEWGRKEIAIAETE